MVPSSNPAYGRARFRACGLPTKPWQVVESSQHMTRGPFMSPPQLSRALLQNLGMFRNLPDADLDSILQYARVCRLQEGEAAFQQGEDAVEFFVLLSGRLKVV